MWFDTFFVLLLYKFTDIDLSKKKIYNLNTYLLMLVLDYSENMFSKTRLVYMFQAALHSN